MFYFLSLLIRWVIYNFFVLLIYATDTQWSRALRESQFDLCCSLEPVITGIAIDLNEFIEREERSKLTTTGYASDFQKVAIVITEVIKSNSEVVFNKFCESLRKHRHGSWAEKLQYDS